MDTISSQITCLTIVCTAVHSGADQKKHQSSASLAFVWGIHRSPVNSPHKGPVTRKMLLFDDVIMEPWSLVNPWSVGCPFGQFVTPLVWYVAKSYDEIVLGDKTSCYQVRQILRVLIFVFVSCFINHCEIWIHKIAPQPHCGHLLNCKKSTVSLKFETLSHSANCLWRIHNSDALTFPLIQTIHRNIYFIDSQSSQMYCLCSAYRENGWDNKVYCWYLSVQHSYLQHFQVYHYDDRFIPFPVISMFHYMMGNYILHAPGELPYEITASQAKTVTQFTRKITYQKRLPAGAPFCHSEERHTDMRGSGRLISITWWHHQMETFPRYWPFVRGIHRSPVNSPQKG